MTISPELEAKIIRLHEVEKWPIGTIATQLDVHHDVIERVLDEPAAGAHKTLVRTSIVDPFLPFMLATLEKYPTLKASRLFEMVRERGYPGKPDHFRNVVARHRPAPHAEAFLRLRTLPGEQAQVDWAHFGRVNLLGAVRHLLAFVMVLSWSRQIFLKFYLGSAMPNFVRGHVEAFDFFGGVPRCLLYDNLKSAVLERIDDAIRFHPTILSVARHYRYEPRPVAVARGNEKGRVERAIRYARDGFYAAREWTDLDDLNRQGLAWCLGVAGDRPCPEDRARTVRELFDEERARLLPLPQNPFPTEERVEVSVGKTPYVRFDLNDYSVPHDHVRRTLVVQATLTTVRVLHGNEVIATHARSFGRRQQIEAKEHIAALVKAKAHGREHRGMDRLRYAVPSSARLFLLAAERGGNLGSMTAHLLDLLDAHGPAAVEGAVAEAVDHDTPHLAAIRQILDRRSHTAGKAPPVPVRLPEDPRVRDLVVRPHALESYDNLKRSPDEPENDKP